MKIKFNFKLNIPNKFKVGNPAEVVSLSNIKSDFLSDNFYMSVHLLIPNGLSDRYDIAAFHLSPDTFVSGNISIDFKNNIATIICDAIFKFSPRDRYKDICTKSTSKWAFGSVNISNSASPFEHNIMYSGNQFENGEIVYGGEVESYTRKTRTGRVINEKFFILKHSL